MLSIKKITFFIIVSLFISYFFQGANGAEVQTEENEISQLRQAEYLNRGGYAIKLAKGVYISWRLLGNEPISQKFDVYKNGNIILKNFDGTNYIDKKGTLNDKYAVVVSENSVTDSDTINVLNQNYIDIKVDKPKDGVTPDGEKYEYKIYEVSVGDVDGDGVYEYFVLWSPDNLKDNSFSGYTGIVYIDCYKSDGEKLWRIDLGENIRAGAHYMPFIVYDFDGDGKAELAIRTAPGSKDSQGEYVSKVGAIIDNRSLYWIDTFTRDKYTDKSDLRETKEPFTGKILNGPDWITMFDGKTGKALQTVNFYPQRGRTLLWGDRVANRSERFLAGVAYLDGQHPSLVMSRGYYERAAMAAYDWDGKNFSMRWKRFDIRGKNNLYGNGNHQLSVCDADNDGKDEIVFGSTVVDDDGKILNSTNHGHGDALHVSDFDNDGWQEIFQVHEKEPYIYKYGVEIRKANNAKIITNIPAEEDVGRGVIANLDDSLDTSIFFSWANENIYAVNGEKVGHDIPVNPAFVIWWDGDLSRELVYKTQIGKYHTKGNNYVIIEDFKDVLSMEKDAPLFQADLFGDWREEICYPTSDNSAIRIFLTKEHTKYKIPTLMHDTQYRAAVAWQNVAYNQPPHPKFYIGKKALDKKNKKYLAPMTGFDKIFVK